GLGYAGSRIAAALHRAHPAARISGTVRSIDRRDALSGGGSTKPPWLTGSVHVLDLDDEYLGLDERGIEELRTAECVVQTVAPVADVARDPLLALHGAELDRSTELRYVAYLSSTGVYGDHGGEWVDEDSEFRCTDAKSLARVRAEEEWGRLERPESGVSSAGAGGRRRVDSFRCGGIYGPGRGPLFSSLGSLEEALADEPPGAGEAQGGAVKYVNRILVDDIAGAILAAVEGDRPYAEGGRAYNLVDDDPAPRRDVAREARRLLLDATSSAGSGEANASPKNAPRPSTTATANTRRRKARGTGNKRCSNARLRGEYGWAPSAPTYREGLARLLEGAKLS
ncbi:hypothetical protein ACHAWF_003981, partial [Thalassiosira exigua]